MSFENVNLTFPDQRDPALESLIESYGERIFAPAKHTVSRPGDMLDCIYYLKEGSTQHFIVNADGSEKLLYTLRPGWLFGETPFYLNLPTNLSSQAKEDSVLIKLPGKVCREILADNPQFVALLIRCYSYKLLTLRYEVENLCFNSCKVRLKRLFCASVDTKNLIDHNWYPLRVRYTQYEMETIVGSTRVNINKTMSALAEEGFIRTINRKVQVNATMYQQYLNEIGGMQEIMY